jgi:hypothetical protein
MKTTTTSGLLFLWKWTFKASCMYCFSGILRPLGDSMTLGHVRRAHRSLSLGAGTYRSGKHRSWDISSKGRRGLAIKESLDHTQAVLIPNKISLKFSHNTVKSRIFKPQLI